MMAINEVIDKWRECHPESNINEGQLTQIANNFLDLIRAWMLNDKNEETKSAIYEIVLHHGNNTTIITDVNEASAVYEIMKHIFPNDKKYETCDLVSIYFDNGKKVENVLGTLTIV